MEIKSYLLGKKSGGGSTINNQNKSITINENGTTSVSADAGYTGLGTVGITTNVTPDLESKSVTINSNTTTVITPSIDKDGLSQVSVTTNVEAQPDLETKSVTITENGTTTITPTTGKDGMSEVEVTTNVSGGGGSILQPFSISFRSNKNEVIDLSNIDLLKASSGSNMFRECNNVKELRFNNFSPTSADYMFYNCYKLETANFDDINLSKVLSLGALQNMFYGCYKLTDESLNKILLMCISATQLTGIKALRNLSMDTGLRGKISNNPQNYSNYQAFIDAGWTVE